MTEAIQFGSAAAIAAATPAEVGQQAPEVPTILADGENAAHDVETLAPDAEQAVEQFAETHKSVLSDLMKNLEGIAHLGKSEIVAVVDQARAKFEQL